MLKNIPMKKIRKSLKIFFISLAALIAVMIISGFVFRNKITSVVKAQINKNLVAEVDFKQVNISFFRHFPRVSIGLDSLQIIGTGMFEKDTLLSAKRLDAAVDIMSFIRGSDMNIYSISLSKPRIHALVDSSGFANWNIVKEDSLTAEEAPSKPFHLQLKKYEIIDGYVFYNDRQAGMRAEVFNLNHAGSGDFTADLFTLKTKTTADSVSFFYGAIPYLHKVKTSIDADLKIDNTSDRYSFENLSVLLNALKITGGGFLKMEEEGYDMDINFKSPDTDFKHLLSLVPAVYKKDFDQVTASGSAAFEGRVKGRYSERSMPGYHVSLNVSNGAFKYPDLPKGIDQINLKAVVDNPDGVTDHTVVNISDASLRMDQDPFRFRLLMKQPVTRMFVDAAAKGRLNLGQMGQFIKLEKGTNIAGLLNADVNIKGNVSDLEKQQYQNFYAGGTIDLNGFNYTSPDYPTGVKINTLHTRFTPSQVDLSNLSGEYLKTRFTGSGHLDNLLNYVFSDKPLRAAISVSADKVNLNEWMGIAEDTASSEASQAFVVPANLNVRLQARVDELFYDKLDIRNLAGSLTIADEAVRLNDIQGNALDGSIQISGSYSTKANKKEPAIALAYKVNQVDIQKAFYAFNTAQKLMPVGKFLAGKLTSALTATGRLGQDMEVEMNTLSGEGNLLLIEGVLSKFAPLERMASTLHVAQLQQLSLKDVKAYFEFSNGRMLIKPFRVKVQDIEMEIGGLQGFDQSIDYTVNLKIPRHYLGAQGNQLVNNLATAVSSRGIPVNLGETVNLQLNLGGTMLQPTIKTDLKQTGESLAAQMEEQVKEFVQAKVDSARAAAADTLTAIKKQLADAAREEARKRLLGISDTTEVAGEKQSAGEKAKESARGLVEGLLKRKSDVKKETADTTRPAGNN